MIKTLPLWCVKILFQNLETKNSGQNKTNSLTTPGVHLGNQGQELIVWM